MRYRGFVNTTHRDCLYILPQEIVLLSGAMEIYIHRSLSEMCAQKKEKKRSHKAQSHSNQDDGDQQATNKNIKKTRAIALCVVPLIFIAKPHTHSEMLTVYIPRVLKYNVCGFGRELCLCVPSLKRDNHRSSADESCRRTQSHVNS